MAGPPSSAYYTWGETTKFTCGPSVAGGAATTALVKDPEGDDVGLGVRTAGGCKCVTTVRACLLRLFLLVRLCVCACAYACACARVCVSSFWPVPLCVCM